MMYRALYILILYVIRSLAANDKTKLPALGGIAGHSKCADPPMQEEGERHEGASETGGFQRANSVSHFPWVRIAELLGISKKNPN